MAFVDNHCEEDFQRLGKEVIAEDVEIAALKELVSSLQEVIEASATPSVAEQRLQEEVAGRDAEISALKELVSSLQTLEVPVISTEVLHSRQPPEPMLAHYKPPIRHR